MGKTFLRLVQVLAVIVLAALALSTDVGAAQGDSEAKAHLTDANGNAVGDVAIIAVRDKLFVTAHLTLVGQAAGFHGFHIHAVGVCDPNAVDPMGARAPFTTAGPHLGTAAGQVHANHDGDLSSLLVNRDGEATLVVETDRAMLDEIFDADGSAIIVHAGPDNFANIPPRYSSAGVPGPDAATLATGDSGGRVACGVLK